MVRQRVRIRFCKQGDLRLLGHRDLARAWERLFRRAGLRVRMSEGFHPKPRISFPSALAMGVSGADEVLEVDLLDGRPAAELAAALAPHLPAGLAVNAVDLLPVDAPPAQVARVRLELPIPEERRAALRDRLARWQSTPPAPIDRGEGRKPIDLRASIESLELADGRLQILVRVAPQGSARPREVLESLGLADLEQQGYFLTRSAVELAP